MQMWVSGAEESNLKSFVSSLKDSTNTVTVTMNQWRMVVSDGAGAVKKMNFNVFLSIGFTAAAKALKAAGGIPSKNPLAYQRLQPLLLDKHLNAYCDGQLVLGESKPSADIKAIVPTNCPFFARSRIFRDVKDKTNISEPKIDDDYLTLYGGTVAYFYEKSANWVWGSEDKLYLQNDKPRVLGQCQNIFIELKLGTDVNTGAFLEMTKSPAFIQVYRLLSTPMIVPKGVTSPTQSPLTNGIVQTAVE